jgi:phosphomevalonate kinase
MSRVASAPGKVMLAGEYAVLEGADAVLATVDRRARARIGDSGQALSPFLRAVRDGVAAHAGARSEAARAARRMIVDSSAFRTPSGTKLGLGSSAAVTVAATACALDVAAPVACPVPDLALIHRLAHQAHGQAQRQRGERGSGADVAASVYGGVVAVRCHGDPDQVPLVVRVADRIEAPLVYLWTGRAADTPSLVARVRALGQRDRAAYDRAIAAVADAAGAVLAALAPGVPAADLVTAIAAGACAVAALGVVAGVELETPVHRAVAALAERAGGAAKPMGAAGGDLVVAAFPGMGAAESFREEARAQGLVEVPLAITAQGVALHEAQAPGGGAYL